MVRTIRLIAAVVTASFCSCGAQALTIMGYTAPNPAQVGCSPCPSHSGYNCLTTAHPITPLPCGRNTSFENAWNQAILGEWDPAGWTLSWSDEQVDAMLNVTTYRAYCHESGGTDGGAEIRIEWAPAPAQTDLRWIQALHTNRPRGYSQHYLDIFILTPFKPPLYPYQYPDQHFYDKPSREFEPSSKVFWNAYLYLARVDRANKIATLYEGLAWGFTLECWMVPECPSSVKLVVLLILFLSTFLHSPLVASKMNRIEN